MMKAAILSIRPAGWAVTATDGFVSLYKEEVRANQYSTHLHGGALIDPLLRLSDVLRTLEAEEALDDDVGGET